MGHYHGTHTKLQFKSGADLKAKDVFFKLGVASCGKTEEEIEESIKDNPYVQAILGQEWWGEWSGGNIRLWEIAYLWKVLRGTSSSFDDYNCFRIEDNYYEFFGSSKYEGFVEMRFLLNAMKDQLVVEDGQIVFRQIYDNNDNPENVIWWDAQAQVFKEGIGWQFGDDHEDKNHPGYSDGSGDDRPPRDPFTKIFIPPMNIMEVYKQQGREFTREVPDWKAVHEERKREYSHKW
jgi:hypothetical protein